jgi:hypothetical protein
VGWRKSYRSVSVKNRNIVVRRKDNGTTRWAWTLLLFRPGTGWCSSIQYCDFFWSARYRTRVWHPLWCRTFIRPYQRVRYGRGSGLTILTLPLVWIYDSGKFPTMTSWIAFSFDGRLYPSSCPGSDLPRTPDVGLLPLRDRLHELRPIYGFSPEL